MRSVDMYKARATTYCIRLSECSILFIKIPPQCIKYGYSEYVIFTITSGSYTLDSLMLSPHEKRRTKLHLEYAAYDETGFGIEGVKSSLMMKVILI